MDTFPERDWKVFRELHAVALERYCAGVVDELTRVLLADGPSAHERYLSVHDLLRTHDPKIARAFDDIRRSTALDQIVAICGLGLLRPDELARFSDETRAYVEGIRDAVRRRG